LLVGIENGETLQDAAIVKLTFPNSVKSFLFTKRPDKPKTTKKESAAGARERVILSAFGMDAGSVELARWQLVRVLGLIKVAT